MIVVEAIPETDHTEHRLGRNVEHDDRSRAYVYRTATELRTYPTNTVHHRRYVPIYDQGDLGSCTGNALCGALMTGGLHGHGALKGLKLGEPDAVDVYSAATRLDSFPGAYPPNDTGSSGIAVCKAAQAKGWVTAYHHIFGGVLEVLSALQHQAVIIGINWYDSFDQPGKDGSVTIAPGAVVRGGHEVCLVGYNGSRSMVTAANSWSRKWGHNGYFDLPWTDLARLLGERGDATVPIVA